MKAKNIILITMMLSLSVNRLNAQIIQILKTNGTQTVHPLNNIRKLVFSSGNMILKSTNGNTSVYGITVVDYFNFGIATNINNIVNNAPLFLFPNPVLNTLTIENPFLSGERQFVKIIGVDGKIVYQKNLSDTFNTNLLLIDVSALSNGFYTCIVSNGITNKTGKFLKN